MDDKWKLVVFFPITLYIFIGTILLALLSGLDALIERLGNYSRFPGLEVYDATQWHKESKRTTALFPLICPFLLLWLVGVFLYAVLAAVLRMVYETIVLIWELIVEVVTAIWEWIVNMVTAIWEWIVDMVTAIWEWIVDMVTAIWEWTIETVEYIWETITGGRFW